MKLDPKRIFSALLVVGLMGFLTGGCEETPWRARRGNTLYLTSPDPIRTLDPAIGYDTTSWTYERVILEGLLDYDDEANLIPAIAESWEVTPDGRTFRFQLRRNVRFTHGREVVAEDFKYALERILNPESTSPGAGFFKNIVGASAFIDGLADQVAGIRVPDSHTLEIELTQPDVSFLNVLAMPFAYAVPREIVEAHPEDVARHIIGAGPFKLETWHRGKRLRLVRNPGYYRPGVPGVDAVEVQIGIPDFLSIMMFERGEIDVSSIPPPDFVRITQDPRWQPCLRSRPQNSTYYLSMNCELEPFTDVRVRRAFNYAIDKEKIVRLLNGRAVPANGVLPPGMPGYNPHLKGYPYDPVKARKLLSEAGIPEGYEIEFVTRSRPAEVKITEAIQQDLKEVGIHADLDPVAFPTWLDLSGRRGRLRFTFNAWFQDYPDPSNFLAVLLHSDAIAEVNSNNRSFYSNPQVDRLLDAASGLTDPQKRIDLYRRAEEIAVRDAAWVFLFHPTDYRLYQPWIEGGEIHPVWPLRLEVLRVKGEE